MAKGASPLYGSKQEEEDWRAECDMRTLMEAEEIQKDSKRLQRAARKAQEKLGELASVAGKADVAKS